MPYNVVKITITFIKGHYKAMNMLMIINTCKIKQILNKNCHRMLYSKQLLNFKIIIRPTLIRANFLKIAMDINLKSK